MARLRGKRLIRALALAFAAVNAAKAENFVFETSMARLVIRSDGVASSLIEKQNNKEQLRGRDCHLRRSGKVASCFQPRRLSGAVVCSMLRSGSRAYPQTTASAHLRSTS